MVEIAVRAAGVVLLRKSSRGPKLLVVHRPRHKDWSLPKGKLDKGEHVVTAAVRECDEETGIIPILGPHLGRQAYPVMGRPKIVDYWVATVGTDQGFTPDSEIDEIRWVTPEQARGLLSYKRDYQMVRRGLAMPPTSPLVLLRHTSAMKRADFKGKNDAQRPLSGKGRSQAKDLVPILRAFALDRIHSSDATRCMQTVQPYASRDRVSIEQELLFSEAGFAEKPKAAVRRITTLADSTHRLCVCSHRPVLPSLLKPFAAEAKRRDQHLFKEPLPPGGMVVVHRRITRRGWDFVACERIEV